MFFIDIDVYQLCITSFCFFDVGLKRKKQPFIENKMLQKYQLRILISIFNGQVADIVTNCITCADDVASQEVKEIW